jgi:hypothetical protein
MEPAIKAASNAIGGQTCTSGPLWSVLALLAQEDQESGFNGGDCQNVVPAASLQFAFSPKISRSGITTCLDFANDGG